MAYLDNSGLYVKIGPEVAVPQAGGEYKTYGELREVEFKLDLTKLTATPAIVPGADNIFIPAGVRIEEVTVVNETAAATGVSIDLGLQQTNRSTEIDYNGILAACVTADFNALGEKITYTQGSSTIGALVTAGTTGTLPGYLTANSTSTLYTTGVLIIRIKYRKV
jgi:hypothetical protein